MRPLKQFGAPVLDALGPMPDGQLNSMLDAAYPKGALNYWKSSFLTALNDDAIATVIQCFARCRPQWALEHVHGAAIRIGTGDTAFPYRSTGYSFLLIREWIDSGIFGRCIAWARETYAAMQPFVAPNRYVNYLGEMRPVIRLRLRMAPITGGFRS
jgi:hypothetical protein